MITREVIGYEQGEPVIRYTLLNQSGAFVQLLNYGARLTAIQVPDAHGQLGNVLLSYPHWQQYIDDPYYLGAVIGRYANRIKQSRFTIDGRRFYLKHNEGLHHLHGGPEGFSFKLWNEESLQHDINSLTLSLESHSGEGGYPGELKVYLSFTWTEEDALMVEFTANTDEPTVLNLTIHPYFNLSAQPAQKIDGHKLRLVASKVLEVDEYLLPTGNMLDVEKFDVYKFGDLAEIGAKLKRHATGLKATGGGYDQCFVHEKVAGLDTIAEVVHESSGRQMEVRTDYPAFQLYTSQWLNTDELVPDVEWRPFSAFCIEPQYLPDAPNVDKFDTPRLDPDEVYQHRIVYQFKHD